MKTLLLCRHAKSSWEYTVSDEKRALLPVGEQRSEKVGLYLHKLIQENPEIKPEKWLSSSAKRAYKTADIITKYCSSTYEINQKLYTFSLKELEREIKNFDNNFKSIAIFGHNEAFTDFINKFGSKEIYNLPTSGIVIIQFNTEDWKTLSKGTTLYSILPKEI